MDNNYMKTILSGIKEWTRSLIQKAADTAQATADNAQAAADNAQATADNAQAAADNAQAAADNAQATADNAQAAADNALHPQILYDDQILIWDGTTTATESTVQVKYFTNVSASNSTKKTRYYRISNISDNVVKYALAHYEDIKCATKVQNGTENEMELIDNWYVDSSGLCVSCEDYYIIIVGESGSHVARFPGVTLPFRIDFPQAGIYIGYCTDSSVEGDAGKSFTHKIALPTYGLPLNSVILTTDSDKNIQIVDTETGTKKTLKSAYAYAQDGGYTGTEAEFAAKLAAESIDKALFVVKITQNSDGTYSADKTFEEITQAYNEGKYNIAANFAFNAMNTVIVPFLAITGAGAAFERIVDIVYFTLLITPNNKVKFEMLPLASKDSKLPNPYPLTFTGAVHETYDGSRAKTIEIPSGGGLGNFERIGTVNFSKEGMAVAGAGVDFEVSDVSEIVLIYKNLVNSTTSNNFVNVYLNKSSQKIESSLRPDSGKSGSPVSGWAFIKLLPGVGLTGIQSNSTFSATNYTLSNAKTPYNMIPLASDFRITEITIQNPSSQYYAVGGIVQVYVR